MPWLNTVTTNLLDGDRLAARTSAMSDFHGRPLRAGELAAAPDWAAAGLEDGDPGEIAGLSSSCGPGPEHRRVPTTHEPVAPRDQGSCREVRRLTSSCYGVPIRLVPDTGAEPDLGGLRSPEAGGSRPRCRAELCTELTDRMGRSRVLIA